MNLLLPTDVHDLPSRQFNADRAFKAAVARKGARIRILAAVDAVTQPLPIDRFPTGMLGGERRRA